MVVCWRTVQRSSPMFSQTSWTTLSQAVPTCFKSITVIPAPKKASLSCFNDYGLVALIPIIETCFEWLVMQHIKSILPSSWTLTNLQIGPTDPGMMWYPLPSTQLLPTWTPKTHIWGCCLLTLVQHSTWSSLISWHKNWTDFGWTPSCATTCWTSWPGDHR